MVADWVRRDRGRRPRRRSTRSATCRPCRRALEAVVGHGESWEEALEDIEWEDGDVLVVGSSSIGPDRPRLPRLARPPRSSATPPSPSSSSRAASPPSSPEAAEVEPERSQPERRPHRDAGQGLADDAVGDERRGVVGADGGRDHLDDVDADELELGGHGADGEQQVARGHAAGLGRAGAGDERGVEDVDVDGQVRRAGADGLDRAPHDLADAEVADVVHEQAGDPALGLPGELRLARPVAAQADLRVAARVEVALVDQAADERAVRELDAEDLGAGVRVGVEVDDADRAVRRPRTRAATAR